MKLVKISESPAKVGDYIFWDGKEKWQNYSSICGAKHPHPDFVNGHQVEKIENGFLYFRSYCDKGWERIPKDNSRVLKVVNNTPLTNLEKEIEAIETMGYRYNKIDDLF